MAGVPGSQGVDLAGRVPEKEAATQKETELCRSADVSRESLNGQLIYNV